MTDDQIRSRLREALNLHGIQGPDERLLPVVRDLLLAETQQIREERDRETEMRRAAEAHVKTLQAALGEKPYPDEYDNMERRAKQAVAEAQALREALAKLPSPIIGGPAFRMDCLWCGAKWRSNLEHPDNGCLWLQRLTPASPRTGDTAETGQT